MEAEYQLTAEEAEKEMEQLRKVFTIVRLVDANGIQCLASGKPSSKNECSCYCFWGKNKPCENCISAIAFRDKAEKTKLEFLDSVLYQVFSKYVEIDGVPYDPQKKNPYQSGSFKKEMTFCASINAVTQVICLCLSHKNDCHSHPAQIN